MAREYHVWHAFAPEVRGVPGRTSEWDKAPVDSRVQRRTDRGVIESLGLLDL